MRVLSVLVILFAAWTVCAEDNSAVWCVGESTKVKPGDAPQDKNLLWDGATKTVTLGSARNEYVAFQIAVRALKDELPNVTVAASDLKGPGDAVIPAANIDLFVEHYLNVTVSSRGDASHLNPACTAGEHPTQMVPFDAKKFGAPFTVGKERNQPVWVDVYVPEDAKAGKYVGTFKVKAGDAVLADLKVALTVWNFTLPQQTHFRTYLYTGPENLRWGHRLPQDLNDPKMLEMEDRYFQMAHQHRLNFHPLAGDGIKEVFETFYKYYDGSGFTQRVGKGVGQNVGFVGCEAGDEKGYKAFANRIVELYEAKKPNALLFTYVWDEPHSAEDFATSKQRCKWVHDAVGKKLKTFIATPQWQKYDGGDVDIYSETSIPDIPKVLERGDTVWAVNGGYAAGPYVDSPGYGGRSIVWMNWKMNLGGWQFWDVCYWVDKQNRKHREGRRWVRDFTSAEVNAAPEKYLHDLWNDPLNFDESRKKGYPMRDAIRINGDGILFYPGYDVGIDGPIASFAMKSLRRGAQDYEYLWLLKEAKRDAETVAIINSVCPEPGKWTDDPEAWEKARLDLAKLLDK